MTRHPTMLLLLLLFTAATRTGQGFVTPSASSLSSAVIPSSAAIVNHHPSRLCYARRQQAFDDISADDLRKDIEEMRKEAMERIAALNEKFKSQSDLSTAPAHDKTPPPQPSIIVDAKKNAPLPSVAVSSDSSTTGSDADLLDLMKAEQAALERPTTVEVPKVPEQQQQQSTTTNSEQLKLMDNTRWRLMLNVGREQGTWMPQTWGISGQRLYLNVELEFSPDQLYEREEFLNGISGTKVLKVVHNEASLSPTMTEGGRKVRVKDGGWRVAPGEGPLGTTVLRFYFELEETTYHNGSDVYCPAGRIYCTCGYFPMEHRHHDGSSMKDVLKLEQDKVVAQYEALAEENDRDGSIMSWAKLQRSKQMMDLRMKANKLAQQMSEAAVKEPERRLLRLSQDQSVGLTKEGGVCCKVEKGLAIEYHILGKFEIASMENREHTDYRELLP